MREVNVNEITETIARLSQEANYFLPEDVLAALQTGRQAEESATGQAILDEILQNQQIARTEQVPICQDTGLAVVFIDIGQDVHLVGGDLREAVNEGVRKGYTEGYLRKSVVFPPVRGKNTNDNTPAILHLNIVPGDKIHIVVAPKGGGSENMSALKMMVPADGLDGVRRFVLETVSKGGSNPCPPVIVGVGIGGNFEHVAYLAKKALLRPVGQYNALPEIADLEKELLGKINQLGIGPMGLGGKVTALWCAVEVAPRHIASFPVAVNIQCHAARHKEAVI